jgi:hypothetical protein
MCGDTHKTPPGSGATGRTAALTMIFTGSMPVRPALKVMAIPPAYVRQRTEQSDLKADNLISSFRQQFLLLYRLADSSPRLCSFPGAFFYD